MADYRVIDADGHVRESDRALRSLLGPLGERRALFPGDSWDRHIRNTLGQSPDSPQQQLADMDADGIDVLVLYPTAGARHRPGCPKRTTPPRSPRPTTTGFTSSARAIPTA